MSSYVLLIIYQSALADIEIITTLIKNNKGNWLYVEIRRRVLLMEYVATLIEICIYHVSTGLHTHTYRTQLDKWGIMAVVVVFNTEMQLLTIGQ